MALFTHSDHIQPIRSIIALVVVVFARLLTAFAAGKCFRAWNRTLLDCRINGVPCVAFIARVLEATAKHRLSFIALAVSPLLFAPRRSVDPLVGVSVASLFVIKKIGSSRPLSALATAVGFANLAAAFSALRSSAIWLRPLYSKLRKRLVRLAYWANLADQFRWWWQKPATLLAFYSGIKAKALSAPSSASKCAIPLRRESLKRLFDFAPGANFPYDGLSHVATPDTSFGWLEPAGIGVPVRLASL